MFAAATIAAESTSPDGIELLDKRRCRRRRSANASLDVRQMSHFI